MEALKTLYALDDKDGNRRELRIYLDPDPQDPHEDDHDYVKLALFHNRYTLPNDSGFRSEDYASWGEMSQALPAKWYATVWMIDHSGISFRVGSSFHEDPGGWDSGIVGFIYMEPQVAAENGIDTHEKFLEVANSYMECYNAYVTGQVYGYQEILLKPTFFAHGEATGEFYEEEIHSCWGYYYEKDILAEHEEYKEAQGFVLVLPGDPCCYVENYGAGERYTSSLEKAHCWTRAKYAEAQKTSEERVITFEEARRMIK